MTTHKHEIKYTPEQKEYTIKLKKKCKWCWFLLLLLLIPLIVVGNNFAGLKINLPSPCNEHNTSGGDGITIDEWNMEEQNLVFYIDYEMYTEPDQMIIYCGKGTSGKVIHKTAGRISGKGSFYIDIGSQCSGTTWITVKIIGGTNTQWYYNIRCP